LNRTDSTRSIDAMVSWSLDHPLADWLRYGIAIIVIAAIAILRAAFITALLPWLPFIPAILLIALLLGEGPGYLASALATALAAVSIATPANPFFLNTGQWAASAVFVVIAFGLTRIGGELRAAFRRLRAMHAETQQREAFLSGILASSTDAIKVLDLDGRMTFLSKGGLRAMEVADFGEIAGQRWADLWTGDGRIEAENALQSARRGADSAFVGKSDTFLGASRWWHVSVSPIFGADGKPDRILAVSRDTTALAEAREQQEMLNAELGHRLKNLLALVQSIASQSFRHGGDLPEISAAFTARLQALGTASDVLTAHAWKSATLQAAIDAGLVSVDGLRQRIGMSGPKVLLEAPVALALTLAVHELATNACKYGALSNDAGTVAITWHYTPVENDDHGRLNLTWQESGGPTVAPPTRRGFGSTMIGRSLRSYFRGETTLDFESSGVVFTVDAPLAKAAVRQGSGDDIAQ
jgi:PAS domain S-box-containing protein